MKNYPKLDGDEVDMVLYYMESRVRILYDMAAAELETEDPEGEPGGTLAHAVECLYRDWKRFRVELVESVRRSERKGFIEKAAREEVSR